MYCVGSKLERCDRKDLCGWHARRKCVHMQFIGGRLEKVWPWEFVWASGMLYNQEDFDSTTERRKMGFTEDSYLIPCIYSSNIFNLLYLGLYLSIHWVIKKRTRSYFIHEWYRFSLLYNTNTFFWWWGSSSAGVLGNAVYPFIAIAPRSTLSQSGSTW